MDPIPQNSAELTFKHIVISFVRMYKFLLSKWLIICLFGFSGGIIGIVYGWLEEPEYEAALTFSTEEDQGASAGGIAGLAAQFGFNLGGVGGAFSGDNILSLLRSRKIITATLFDTITVKGKPQSLFNIYLEASHLNERIHHVDSLKNLTFPPGLSQQYFTRTQDSILLLVIKDLSENQLKVSRPDNKVQIYSIVCKSNSEFFSKEFVTRLIANVSDFYISTKTKRSKETVAIIQGRADSVKRAFDAALEGRAYLADANINPAFQGPLVGIQKKQTDISVLGTAYGEIVKNLELAKFNLLRETPFVQIIDEPLMPLKRIRIGRLMGGIFGGIIFGVLGVVFVLSRQGIKNAKKNYSL